MGNLTLNGATSGQITLSPTAVAGTNTITLPAATGTVLTTAGGQTISGTTTVSTLAATTINATTIQIGGNQAVNGPAFSATLSANQSISSTTSKIQFNTKDFDTNNNYDAVTNYRFTPTVAGYYQVNIITTSSNSAGSGSGTFIYVYKNGVAYRGQGSDAPGANYNQALSVCCVMPFNGTTDYIEAYLRTGGSVTLYTTLNATNASSFSATLVRGL